MAFLRGILRDVDCPLGVREDSCLPSQASCSREGDMGGENEILETKLQQLSDSATLGPRRQGLGGGEARCWAE